MKRKKVYICAPYSGTLDEMIRNEHLAKNRCRAIYEAGYDPIAPQLYYPRFLDDSNPAERRDGLEAAKEWLRLCDEIWVYGDRITLGMSGEIKLAEQLGIPRRNIK